jgi:hypothetical protein
VQGFAGGTGTNATGSGVTGVGGSHNGSGVSGFGGGAGPGVVGSGGGNSCGVLGFASGEAGTGVTGIGAGSSLPSPLGNFAGVFGFSSSDNGIGVWADASNGGFSVGVLGKSTQGFAGLFEGRVLVTGDLDVFGAKSAVVPFPDGSHRRLYSMESPESWFEDFGIGHLVNGQAEVHLAADFASVVNSDSYHVFMTEYEDNNALYVTKRTNTGFVVRAKSSKTATGTFSYRVVAKRKDIAGPRFEKVTIPTEKRRGAPSEAPTLPLPPPAPPRRAQ